MQIVGPSSPQRNEAIAAVRRGWPVIPLHAATAVGCTCRRPDCPSPGKHPITDDGCCHGLTDVVEVSEQFQVDLGIMAMEP